MPFLVGLNVPQCLVHSWCSENVHLGGKTTRDSTSRATQYGRMAVERDFRGMRLSRAGELRVVVVGWGGLWSRRGPGGEMRQVGSAAEG